MTREINEYEALEEIQDIHVPSKRDARIVEHINMLLKRDSAGNPTVEPVTYSGGEETRGSMVVGPARCGKTTIIKHTLHKTEPYMHFWSENPNALVEVKIPNPATLKSVGDLILDELGYKEKSAQKKAWEIWKIVRHRIELLGVKILWLDEAQDVMKTKAEKDYVLGILKTLMQGENAITIILSGTELLSDLVKSDAQISGRFHKYYFPSLSYATDQKGVSRLMDKYGTMLGRTIAYDDELIERLMHAINYRFGLCIEMIVQACAFAVDRHDGDITIDDFAGFYSFYTGCEMSENVFLNSNWARINCDHQPCDEIVKPKARRKK